MIAPGLSSQQMAEPALRVEAGGSCRAANKSGRIGQTPLGYKSLGHVTRFDQSREMELNPIGSETLQGIPATSRTVLEKAPRSPRLHSGLDEADCGVRMDGWSPVLKLTVFIVE